MDETGVRAMLDRALDGEPPIGPLVAQSLERGRALRRRRWAQRAAGSFAVVAVIAGVGIVGSLAHHASPLGGPAGYVISGGRGISQIITPIGRAGNQAASPAEGLGTGTAAITPDGKTVYVITYPRITPVFTATGRRGPQFRAGPTPETIAMAPDGKTAYVLSLNAGTLTPFATATDKAGQPIPVGNRPREMVFTPDGATGYVVSQGSGTVTPIDTATNTLGKPIKVGSGFASGAWQIAMNPNGRAVYALGGSNIVPIATATNKPGKPIKVSSFAMAFTPDGKTAYVLAGDSVVPINTATNTPGSPIPVCPLADGIAVNPDGQTAYALCQGYKYGEVTPIATRTNTPGRSVIVGKNPDAIFISGNGKVAYVASPGLHIVTPINTTTNRAGKPIRFPGDPYDFVSAP
jgi:YVTN family beta-propeller protein